MFIYVWQAIYAYIALALCVCFSGWVFEKIGIFPHAVYFSAKAGRYSCFGIGTAILVVALNSTILAFFPASQVAVEIGILAAGLTIGYSLIHIHSSYIQISVTWRVVKRLEKHVYSHIGELDRDRYAAYAEALRADELFSHIDPQYHELYDYATAKLAMDIGLM